MVLVSSISNFFTTKLLWQTNGLVLVAEIWLWQNSTSWWPSFTEFYNCGYARLPYGGRRPEPDTQILSATIWRDFFSTETIIITGRHIKHDGFRFRTRFTLCVFLPTVATIFRRTSGVTWAHFQCYLDDKYVGGFSTFCMHNGDFFWKEKKWKNCLKY